MSIDHRFRFAMLAGASLFACSQAAIAQDASADAGGDASEEYAAEIVVTASKREERLQDVPVAVTVVGGDQLTAQNISSAAELTRAVPSLNGADAPGSAISVRGIGTSGFARSSEGSVAIVLDGVALANTSNVAPQFFDIARIEVLEGPQGMLFGRNASAGLINITTVDPNPDKVEFVGHADIGTRNTYNLQSVVNLPLADNAALRMSGAYSLKPRLIRNVVDGSYDQSETISARARLKWEPIDALTLNLIADYNRRDRDGGGPWSIRQVNPAGALAGRLAACGVTVSRSNNETCVDGPANQIATAWGVSFQIDADFGFATLTSVSAYRDLSTDGGSDADSLTANVVSQNAGTTDVGNFSQELRLTSNGSNVIDYVVGAYYYDSVQDYTITQAGQALQFLLPANNPLRLLKFGRRTAIKVDTESLAVFGQATVNFTDALRAIAGFRYGGERLTTVTTRSVAPGAVATFPAVLGSLGDLTPNSGRVRDTYFSYRLGGQFELSNDVMAYVTYTRGYKAPAVNDEGAGNIVDAEVPMAWEGGMKASLFDRKLALNLAVFHTKVRDFQTLLYDSSTNSFNFANAPSLKSKGASLTLFGKPAQWLSLNAGLMYTDATFGPGFIVQCAPGQTAAAGCQTFPRPGGGTFTGDDVTGNRLPNSPKWKFTLGGDITAPLSDSLDGYLQFDGVYTSKQRFSQAFDPNRIGESQFLAGGRIGIRTSDDRLGLGVYVRNIFNKRNPVFIGPNPLGALTGDGLSYFQVFGTDSYRTVGASVDFRF
jgi:iron complex outermembrane recepter protein